MLEYSDEGMAMYERLSKRLHVDLYNISIQKDGQLVYLCIKTDGMKDEDFDEYDSSAWGDERYFWSITRPSGEAELSYIDGEVFEQLCRWYWTTNMGEVEYAEWVRTHDHEVYYGIANYVSTYGMFGGEVYFSGLEASHIVGEGENRTWLTVYDIENRHCISSNHASLVGERGFDEPWIPYLSRVCSRYD